MKTIKKAAVIAALAAATAVPIAAQTSVNVQANGPSQGLAADALYGAQFRTIISSGQWRLGMHGNQGQYGNSNVGYLGYEFLVNDKDGKAVEGTWKLMPGFRAPAPGISEVSLITSKQLSSDGKERFHLNAAIDDNQFFSARTWRIGEPIGGMRFDYGVGVKAFDRTDLFGKKTGVDVIAGTYTRDEDLGIWVGKATNHQYGIAGTVDKPDFAAYLFSKSNRENNSSFGVLQMSFGGDGKRFSTKGGGQYTPASGFGTEQVLTGQRLPPFNSGDQPSHLVSNNDKSAWNAEVGFAQGKDHSYIQAETGKHVVDFGKISLYGSAGAKWNAQKDHVAGIASFVTRLHTQHGTLDATVRATPELTVTLGYNGRF